MAKVEAKKETISIAVYKANLHCPKCAHDIKKPLMRTPGNIVSMLCYFKKMKQIQCTNNACIYFRHITNV